MLHLSFRESSRHKHKCPFNFYWELASLTFTLIFGPGHPNMCLMAYANDKGADQPAHPRNLISTFVVRCLDSIMPLVSISEISRL